MLFGRIDKVLLSSIVFAASFASADWFNNERIVYDFGPKSYLAGTPAKTYTDQVQISELSRSPYILIVSGDSDNDDLRCPPGLGGLLCLVRNFFDQRRDADDIDWVEVQLNGKVVVSRQQVKRKINVSFQTNLKLGANSLQVKVQGKATSSASVTLEHVVAAKPPVASLKVVSQSSGVAPFTALFDATGSSDPQSLALTYLWDFGDGGTSTSGGLVPHQLNPGQYNVSLTVKNTLGLSNTAHTSINVTKPIVPVLPPPDSIPPIPVASTGSLTDSVSFLYSGANPIQTGVVPGAIDNMRISVLRGKVFDSAGNPLPGVQVTVLGSTGLGQTFTQSNGQYDMAANGGGNTTLNFVRNGYLSSQRTIVTGFQDYYTMPDVVMAQPDPKVTVVSLGVGNPQVVRASAQSDASGSRTAIIVIPSQTTAKLVLPDGSTMPMSQLSLRATELTVGPNGPTRMPANLPATTSYTYAVDISSDEGIALGAKHIQFSKPVPFYVDNFLGFPARTTVPVGQYDKDLGLWLPQPNGRVIQVLSVNSGSAVLDVVGNAAAASSGDLTALGISTEELAQLATVYLPGQSFWRAQSDRFSPQDLNFQAVAVKGSGAGPNHADDPPPCYSCPCPGQALPGSIISPMTQSLGEVIPLVGTPITLNYTTRRSLARAAERRIWVPISPPSPDQPVEKITLSVTVAGQTLTQTLTPPPNATVIPFVWDGKDAYGRILNSAQLASISVGTSFQVKYTTSSNVGTFSEPQFGMFNPDLTETSISVRSPTEFESDYRIPIGTQSAINEVAGWLINVHHFYDPVTKRLYFGDGQISREAASLSRVVTTSGNGHSGFSGDGGPASNALLNQPAGAFSASDGSVYFADVGNARIRKIALNGVISTVAGNGGVGFSGDGGPATSAQVRPSTSTGFAEGMDHSIYFSDSSNRRIRRIAPDGTISTYVGNGLLGYTGDGGLATQASMSFPSALVYVSGTLYFVDAGNSTIRGINAQGLITTFAGTGNPGYSGDGGRSNSAQLKNPTGLAISNTGDFFVADTGNNVIRKITSTGMITTFAGTGVSGFSGDGSAASSSQLRAPNAVALRRDGTLFISDSGNNRIRMVTSDGNIVTVAGTGTTTLSIDAQGDSGAATSATFNGVSGLSIQQDDSVVVSDTQNYRIRLLTTVMPSASVGNIVIPSADGSEIYVFTPAGIHLQTLNSYTGAAKWNFAYDSMQNLISLTDGDGNVTQIQRDTSGAPVAIVSPYGQVTQLTVGTGGNLVAVQDPLGQAYQMNYTGGLLSQFTKPSGSSSNFTYDSLGNLALDQDAAGGSTALQDLLLTDGHQTNAITAEGRTSTYSHHINVFGYETTNSSDGGGAFSQTQDVAATQNSFKPAGYTDSSVLLADPRLGLPAVVSASRTVQVTGFPPSSITDQRSFVASTTADPFAFQITDLINVNGDVSQTTYNGITKTFTTTSAAGRTSSRRVDGQGRTLQSQIGNLTPTIFTYDSRGRLVTVAQGPTLMSLNYDSSGNLAAVTDPLNQTTAYAYDPVGRMTRMTIPDGRQVGFTYDSNGNLTSFTPPGRPKYSFVYNLIDLAANFIQPLVGTSPTITQYSYNHDRQLASVTRPDGSAISYNYATSSPKLLSVTSAQENYSYNYDPAGRLLSSVSSDGVSSSYSYVADFLVSAQVAGPVTTSSSFIYNQDLNIAASTVSGVQFGYQYDGDRLLSAILTSGGNMTITRDQAGLVTGTKYQNLQDQYTYDSFGAVISYSAGSLYAMNLTRDNLGRIVTKQEAIQGVTNIYGYTYDLAGRLTAVSLNGSPHNSYTYDLNGNRIAATVNGVSLAGTYDSQDRLISYGANTYTYDANGSLNAKTNSTGTTTYGYNINGKLTNVNFPDGTSQRRYYDALGKIIARTEAGSIFRTFAQDEQGRVGSISGSGTVERFGYGTKSNVPDIMLRNGVPFRVISDQLGSVRLVVSAITLQIAQRMDYDEFGQVMSDTNPGFQPFGFAGGLYNSALLQPGFGARHYDPETGRWAAKDPIGFAGGDTNLYGYVVNDPVNKVDPRGTGPVAGGICSVLFGYQQTRALQQFLNLRSEIGSIEKIIAKAQAALANALDTKCPNAGQISQLQNIIDNRSQQLIGLNQQLAGLNIDYTSEAAICVGLGLIPPNFVP